MTIGIGISTMVGEDLCELYCSHKRIHSSERIYDHIKLCDVYVHKKEENKTIVDIPFCCLCVNSVNKIV